MKKGASKLIEEAQERPDALKLHRMELEKKAAEARAAELLERLHQTEARVDLFASLKEAPRPKPIKKRERKSRLREATAVILASDWHVGEEVRAETVNGRNTYTPDVARIRVERFAEGACWQVNLHRNGYKIRDVVLCLLGDMVTGWLHQDQVATNTLLPMPEVLFAYDLIDMAIQTILRDAQPERLIIPCNFGNHARTTYKTLNNAQAECSVEYLIYNFLARKYQEDSRVQFQISDGKFNYLDVYDFRVRTSHGDDIRGGQGIGGVAVPALRALAKWNEDKRYHADIDVMGHFHTDVSYRNLVINPSLIGNTPYGMRYGATKPSQTFFLIEPGQGKRAHNLIWVERPA